MPFSVQCSTCFGGAKHFAHINTKLAEQTLLLGLSGWGAGGVVGVTVQTTARLEFVCFSQYKTELLTEKWSGPQCVNVFLLCVYYLGYNGFCYFIW